MRNLLLISLVCILLTGCMTERQAWLISKDMDQKKDYPVALEIRIKGPLNIPEGGELVIPYQSQPYKPYPIPDDGKRITGIVTNGINTAAITGAVIYGIHSAKGNKTTNNTTNNYNGGTP